MSFWEFLFYACVLPFVGGFIFAKMLKKLFYPPPKEPPREVRSDGLWFEKDGVGTPRTKRGGFGLREGKI
ncbi:hypothetical protein [Candidatus Absconditicoccus praedator]|uniref:hypothetical protein n=1 Tax=Candidatus Absconditicoccus praedator TaxID=2735562 RepID=UPI001E2FC23A|nr:hypothetical protein [Candidatus Absconditicoccus praedator]UFX82729.1 hypothetical protein HLG78_01075 [Candidatus Absconditicoccus praedator]